MDIKSFLKNQQRKNFLFYYLSIKEIEELESVDSQVGTVFAVFK